VWAGKVCIDACVLFVPLFPSIEHSPRLPVRVPHTAAHRELRRSTHAFSMRGYSVMASVAAMVALVAIAGGLIPVTASAAAPRQLAMLNFEPQPSPAPVFIAALGDLHKPGTTTVPFLGNTSAFDVSDHVVAIQGE